jgi:RND family efflux transporter MFP subunit
MTGSHFMKKAPISLRGKRFAASFLVCFALAQHTALAEDAPAAPVKAALAVTVASPTEESWNSGITASGSLNPWQEAIIASEISGLRITDILADVGGQVKKGQELVKLSQASVKADVAQAQAKLDAARTNADRARRLKDSGSLPAQQIDQYLTDEAVAQAALDAQQIRLSQTRIVAPDNGIISSRSATLGAVMQPGTELFRMVRQNKIEWRAEVAGRDVAQIQPGQAAHLTLPTGETVTGEVRIISPTLDASTRNAPIYVSLPTDSPAKAGMFAEGEILTGSANALTLPQTAVILRDGNSYAFEIGKENRVSQRLVKVGRRAEGRVEIIDGLAAKARVVATGGAFLNDGDTVQIVDKK